MRFSLSIIIPTHKRTDILRQCLECIGKQTLLDTRRLRGAPRNDVTRAAGHTLEVVVVSDGPDEKTAEMIQSLSWPFEVQHFAIPKSQQGIARNRAVEKARGKYSILIGDDIFLAADACEKHLAAHEAISDKRQAASAAVLGYMTWDPTLTITPLMKWMERSGVQFGYPKIAQYAHDFLPGETQHFFTYTSNVSLPTKLLWQYRFREDVSSYGWEDIEWGRRLVEAGVRLFYEPDARGYHHHAFTDTEVWERSRKLGEAAVEMERLLRAEGEPLGLLPSGVKALAYHLLALLPTYKGRHRRAFLQGVRTARRRARAR